MDGTFPTRRVFRWTKGIALALSLIGSSGCSQFSNGTTAKSFLSKIRESPDPNVRYFAYAKLASPGCYEDAQEKTEVVKLLNDKLGGAQEPIATRAVICRTLGELHDPSSREPLMKAIGDPEGLVRGEACRALGKVGQPEDATALARVMMVDTLEDCRIAAIEGLGTLRAKDPRIMQMLVAGMEHDDPAMRLASLKALRNITGLDRGVDPAAWRDAVMPQVAARPAADSPAAAAAAAAIERK